MNHMMPGMAQPVVSQAPPPFCGVPGAELQAMAQATWQVGDMNTQHASMCQVGGGGMGSQAGQMSEQPSISLSAQAELELELSLRGSLLVQQQRRIVQLEDELQRAWAEIDRLRTKIAAVERERQRSEDDSQKQPRYWTPEEHRLFMEAVQRYGWKDVKSIAQHVGTRTPTQVRTHAQKLFLRQQKEQTGIMQPVKNEGDLPPIPPLSDASPASSAGVDMQALQQAGYLAQLTDAAEGMGSKGDGDGDEAPPPSSSDGMDMSAAVARPRSADPDDDADVDADGDTVDEPSGEA